MKLINKKITESYKIIHNFYKNIQFRDENIPIVNNLIDSEISSKHWKHLNVKNKIVLDLGCGFWDLEDIHETSPIFFKNKGALEVIGVDMNNKDILFFDNYFKNELKDFKSKFICTAITKSEQLEKIILRNNIESIKSDIEGFEVLFFKLKASTFEKVTSMSFEYHSQAILLELLFNFKKWGFEIIDHSLFNYSTPTLGVITVEKNRTNVKLKG